MTRDVILVLQVSGPESSVPLTVCTGVHNGSIVLIPAIDRITRGVKFTSVRIILPVVIPAQCYIATKNLRGQCVCEPQLDGVFRCVWQLVSVKALGQPFLPWDTKCIEDSAVDKLRNAVVIVCAWDDCACGYSYRIE